MVSDDCDIQLHYTGDRKLYFPDQEKFTGNVENELQCSANGKSFCRRKLVWFNPGNIQSYIHIDIFEDSSTMAFFEVLNNINLHRSDNITHHFIVQWQYDNRQYALS